jgi:hypothetical protein
VRFGSVSEPVAAEKLVRGYLVRILMLTLLAPDIVETILVGPQPEGMTLPGLMEGGGRWSGRNKAADNNEADVAFVSM